MMNSIDRKNVYSRLIWEDGQVIGTTTEGAQKPTERKLGWEGNEEYFEIYAEGDVIVESDIPYEYGVFEFDLTVMEALALKNAIEAWLTTQAEDDTLSG
jgi:hypothetical protein